MFISLLVQGVVASIILVALQPNIKSTGVFDVFCNNRTQEIKPTTQASTRAILSQKSHLNPS